MLAYRIHTFMERGHTKHFGEQVGGAKTILLSSVILRILTYILLTVLLDDVCAWMCYFSYNTWMQ